mgnify:CR=1 FL=1
MTRICILGGGFGGLYTALRLSQLPWTVQPEIVLVDQRDRFVFLPLLYELVTGEMQSWEVAPAYAELLADTGIQFRQATVDAINKSDRTVRLGAESNHELIHYDRLVIAMGGETPLGRVPGSAEHALTFRSLEDAQRLSDRLRVLENESESVRDRIRVAVVGAGYSGVELACNLSERLGDRGRVRLVELGDKILRLSPEFNRKAALKALSDRSVWLDLETSVEALTADTITLNYHQKSDEIPVDIVLWTVGTQVVPVVQDLAVAKNDRGQIRVNTYLQVEGDEDLYALGDLADCRDVNGQPIPTTAQAAFQQADYVGWNVWASLNDKPLLSFQYQHLGEMMTLGSDDATLAGLGVQLNGAAAHLARRMIYLMRMPTFDHQVKVGISWLTRPLADWLKAAR